MCFCPCQATDHNFIVVYLKDKRKLNVHTLVLAYFLTNTVEPNVFTIYKFNITKYTVATVPTEDDTLLLFEGMYCKLYEHCFFPQTLRVKFTSLDVFTHCCFSEKLPAAGNLALYSEGNDIK